MPYTIDGSSCVKGGTYTLSSLVNNAASFSFGSHSPDYENWKDAGS